MGLDVSVCELWGRGKGGGGACVKLERVSVILWFLIKRFNITNNGFPSSPKSEFSFFTCN